MNRRRFMEALGAACIAQPGLASKFQLVNSAIRDPQSATSATLSPILVPIPSTVANLPGPVVDLAGTWLFNPTPPDEFWKEGLDTSKWSNVEMPNEFETLGYSIVSDFEYPCRKTVRVPAEFANHRIFIRFDGVYSHARVWVNGVFIRDHDGGFTSWDVEITPHVKAGSNAEIVVGITDRHSSISKASYYAKHRIAGILRSVRMYAVPSTHLCDLSVVASYKSGQTGVVSIHAAVSSPDSSAANLRFRLRDSSGHEIDIRPASDATISAESAVSLELNAPLVKAWDAEHPNLYTLQVALISHGEPIETVERTIGFRTVERIGNQLLVNGQPVKLHGVCRHSIHPLSGRVVSPELDEKDAKLFREANINFVRTSHYPPTEAFLQACDRHGIYVEEESAVCWSQESSSNPELREEFLGQFREMITRDRHHPCVLFWSLANESTWGSNIAAERKYACEHDPSRPVIFSYPDTAPMESNAYDIYSKHYADAHSSLVSPDVPLMNDEFGAVAVYDVETLRRDPGVRNFWGESIKRFADQFFVADGCLGGSIWAAIDEVFLLPGGPIGYGEWGVIDGWRRPKPEYWLTKKAYSPIRIDETAVLPVPDPGKSLQIPVRNAFNHTDFREIEIQWAVGSETGQLASVNLGPHRSGVISLPPRSWKAGERVRVDFTAKGTVVEQVELLVGEESSPSLPVPVGDLRLTDRGADYRIDGPKFFLAVSKETGLITGASWNEEPILQSGPFLDLGEGPIQSWLLTHLEVKMINGCAVIFASGEGGALTGIDTIPVEYQIVIDGGGRITTHYRVVMDGQGAVVPPEVRLSKYPNIGIAYLFSESFDTLSWKRKALWSRYPDDHIGRPEGTAKRSPGHASPTYRQEPTWPWSQDAGSFFLSEKSTTRMETTNDFCSLKSNIWWASLRSASGKAGIRVEANADLAVRASMQPGASCLSIYNFWSYPDIYWGNYVGPEAKPPIATHVVEMKLTD